MHGSCPEVGTYSKIGSREAVAGGDRRRSGGVRVEGIDIRQKRAHHSRNPRTKILCRKAVEMPAQKDNFSYTCTNININKCHKQRIRHF